MVTKLPELDFDINKVKKVVKVFEEEIINAYLAKGWVLLCAFGAHHKDGNELCAGLGALDSELEEPTDEERYGPIPDIIGDLTD